MNDPQSGNTGSITGTGVAVALAVIVVLGLIFFGPQLFNLINNNSTSTETTSNASSTAAIMQNQNQPNNLSTSTSNLGPIPTNVTTLEGKDIVVGTGTIAQPGDSVTVQYVGALTNGTVFDASANHGTQGFTFTLGAGQVIKGWDEGVVGMKVGGERELVIPPSLGYGAQANGPIPANSTLVFEIELVNVQAPAATSTAQ